MSPASGQAQTTDPSRLVIGSNVAVANGLEDRPLVEPHLAAHPGDPDHLLGAVMVSHASEPWQKHQFCSTLLSLDGGQSWERHDFEIQGCGDPWVAITPDGKAVFAALGEHAALTQQEGGALAVFHSPDGGRTWDETPIGLGRAHDHQTITVDATGGPRHGWLYLVSGQGIRTDEGKLRWSAYVARSRDGGTTFDEPTKFVPSNLNLNTEVPVVLSDGTLVVSFVDHHHRNAETSRFDVRLDRSRVWVARSTDGGHSLSMPLFATEACGSGWSDLAVDPGPGEFMDRLYLVCKQRGGGAIVLHRSTDGGEAWSDPVVVHSAAADTAIYRAIPAVAVNGRGEVGISWIDGRGDPSGECHEVYFTASLDGGVTFLPERRVSDEPSCPDTEANGAAFERWPGGGDYHGLATAGDRFHAFWADSRTGIFQLWTAPIQVQGRSEEER